MRSPIALTASRTCVPAAAAAASRFAPSNHIAAIVALHHISSRWPRKNLHAPRNSAALRPRATLAANPASLLQPLQPSSARTPLRLS